jgi:hypothetical protein
MNDHFLTLMINNIIKPQNDICMLLLYKKHANLAESVSSSQRNHEHPEVRYIDVGCGPRIDRFAKKWKLVDLNASSRPR